MISERQLVRNYPSFWKSTTPMADVFWRAQNLQAERYWEPITSHGRKESRAFINELAFEAFAQSVSVGANVTRTLLKDFALEGSERVAKYLSRFTDHSSQDTEPLTDTDLAEIVSLALRLNEFFRSHLRGGHLTLRPRFFGCGCLMAAEGDVLINQTLYEVKAGDRSFRVPDLRQLLVYCALNRAKPIAEISSIALLNPRVGLYWSFDLDACARAVSGRSAPDLLEDIAYFAAQTIEYQ